MVWLAVAEPTSCSMPHRRRGAAAQHHVEPVAERPVGLGDVQVEGGDQPVARGEVRHRVEDRVERQQRVAGEIHLGDQAGGEGRAEIGEMDVVRPPGVLVVGPRIGAGADGQELVAPLRVGEDAAVAVEVGIERRVVLVGRMVVAAGGIGLPDLDHGVGHRAAGFVGDGAGDDDALAQRGLAGGHRQVGERREVLRREAGAGGLGDGVRDLDRRLVRMPLDGAEIGRRVVRSAACRACRAGMAPGRSSGVLPGDGVLPRS